MITNRNTNEHNNNKQTTRTNTPRTHDDISNSVHATQQVMAQQMCHVIETFDKLPRSWLQKIKEATGSFADVLGTGFAAGLKKLKGFFGSSS